MSQNEAFSPSDSNSGTQFAQGQSNIQSKSPNTLLKIFPGPTTIKKTRNALKVVNVFADTFCSGFHAISIPHENRFPWSPWSPECLKVCKFKCQHQWSTCMLKSPAKQRPWALSHCKNGSLSTSRLLCQGSHFNINTPGDMVQESSRYCNELRSPYFWTRATPQLSGLR